MAKDRILIIEDEPNLREILRFQLLAAGYEVIEAVDGAEGIERARSTLPDLILCDVMMPNVDGYQVVRDLRASFITRHIPIIMLTAKAEMEDKIHGLDDGANDYIIKPWDHRELRARVRNSLNWSQQQRSASPLTGLPGNLSIDEEIRRRLGLQSPLAFLQIDIDHFKSFNDFYGYARGDEAIRKVARILVDQVQKLGNQDDFVGHIGGDDFVIVTQPGNAVSLGEAIVAEFDKIAATLYDEADRIRGYVEIQNRQHVIDRFPLMSLTLALVDTQRMPIRHQAELSDIAQELKALGKGISGSVMVNERRSGEKTDGSKRDVA
jgi:diguanylate cyclase (GGDEF)-like protein